MLQPKTSVEDLLEFDQEEHDLRRLLVNGSITQEEFNERTKNLNERYKDKLPDDDVYLFDDVGGLFGFLYDNFRKFDQVDHEILHAAEAAKLGYTVKYGCRVMKVDEEMIAYRPFIQVMGPATPEDLAKIASASGDSSDSDKRLMELAGYKTDEGE